jgi:glycosyltransferase involved in cell wall biosynthesis
MKILQINSLFAPRRFGGAEVLLERLSESLAHRGHQVQVACLSPEPAPRDDAPLAVHEFGLRNVYWPFDGQQPRPWLKFVWHLRNSFGQGGAADIESLLRRERPDLVHTHNLSGFTTAVWGTVQSQGIPIVHTIHDYALLCPATTMLKRDANCDTQCLGCRLLSWPKARQSQAVSAVVGCSGFVLDRHLKAGYFSAATQHVIHNSDPFEEDRRVTCASRLQPLRVGYLGRLAQPKGIEFMLDALTQSEARPWELVVAGTGEPAYEASLRQRYERRGVRFAGRVEAARFLGEIDVLVVPSLWHEPCPLVVGEAANAGVPVVAASVGGIPEIVRHGLSGFLFAPRDAEALTGHVLRLAADPELCRRLSAYSRIKAADYSFETMVDRYLEVYSQTLTPAADHGHIAVHR